MKLQVERDALADAVAWAARSLATRPAMPVLAGLRLAVDADHLTIAGFDYEVSSEVAVPVTQAEPGELLVPGRLLAEITRSLPGQPVELAQDGARVQIRCGASRFRLPTLPLDEYPPLPTMPGVVGTVGSDAFAAAVASVAVAAGRDDTLPMLTGVRVEIEGETVTLAATDRYRLAVRRLRWNPANPTLSTSALVPARTLADTARTLTTGAEVEIALTTPAGGVGEGMIGFASGGRRTTSRLLDGEFPKYQSLLPTESTAMAEVDTPALVDAVKRVALVAARMTPVRISFETEVALLEAGGGDDAEGSETLPVRFEGEPLTIAFNPGYLLDGLGALDSDVARLSFTAPTRPALLTGKSPDEGGQLPEYRYLLMPVRLSG
jgi:DNA polymerase-3 subunit beta